MLGNGRLEAYCFDGVKRLAIIRGKMQKKVWMGNGDIVLVSLRDFQDGKCDGRTFVVEAWSSRLRLLLNA